MAKKTAAAASKAANQTKKISYKSVNTFSFSGRLTEDAHTNDEKKYARFSLAHNYGKGMMPAFLDVTMFPKNGNKDVEIPFDLLKKGTPVVASGYIKPKRNRKGLDFIALTVVPAEAGDNAQDEEAA